MITQHHYHNYGYIALVVEHFMNLPAQIEIDGKILFKKDELHISLMALKYLVPLVNIGANNASEDDLVRDFLEYQSTTDLSQFQPSNIFRYVKRDKRETIIVMVDVPNLEWLFDMLRIKYGVNIPTQPTHITIYTLQPEAGIGILSQSELERDSKQVVLPELKLIWQ
jgi:hypothetical protein